MTDHPVSGNRGSEKHFYILGDEQVFRSKSPEIFSTIMNMAGVKGTYAPFRVKPGEIGDAIRKIRLLNATGANVTAPFKEAVIPHLDELSEGAIIIGSINTIVCKGGTLKGYNTNAIGFMDALKDAGFNAAGKSALVLGTGGAARAVVFILKWIQTDQILVTGRSQKNIGAIVSQIGGEAISLDALPDRPLPVDLLVNATPVSAPELAKEYPLILITGNRHVVYFHSANRNVPWLREIAPEPRLTIHPETAARLGIENGDRVWIEAPEGRGRTKMRAELTAGLHPKVVHAPSHWWFPEVKDPSHGCWDSNINAILSNDPPYDPITGATPLRGCLCRIYKMKGA